MTLSPTGPARHTTPPDGVAGSGPVEPFGMAPVTRAPDAATSPRIRVRGTHSSTQAPVVAGGTSEAREEGRPAGKGKADRTVPLAQAPAGGNAPHATVPLAGQNARDAWKAAQSARNAAQRRRRGRYTRKTPGQRFGPGMARRTPPEPPQGGDTA